MPALSRVDRPSLWESERNIEVVRKVAGLLMFKGERVLPFGAHGHDLLDCLVGIEAVGVTD